MASTLQVNTITNAAGTGGVSFSQGIVGVTDGSAATAGNVGEVKNTSQTTATNFGGSAGSPAYADGGSLSLTAGDWLVSIHTLAILNGSTTTQVYFGLGTATGNSATGLTDGTTASYVVPPTAATPTAATLVNMRVSLSTTTTYYWKVYAVYSAGTPQYKGYMTAVRIR